jgi:hypothetical protein
MTIPMSLGEHIALEAYEARLLRQGFAARTYQLGRTVLAGLACSLSAVAVALVQVSL